MYRGRSYGHDNIVVRVSAKSCAYDLERRRKFRLCDWSNLTLAKRDWPNWLRLRYHAHPIVQDKIYNHYIFYKRPIRGRD